jgi:hypothetical protein
VVRKNVNTDAAKSIESDKPFSKPVKCLPFFAELGIDSRRPANVLIQKTIARCGLAFAEPHGKDLGFGFRRFYEAS